MPLISIIVLTKNEERNIGRCLKAIFSQEADDPFEVIIIDSGSTDRTLAIARQYPVRIHEIPAHEFGHGRTRALGASLAAGELIVFTVADAWAADSHWLKQLTMNMDGDSRVAGVYGRQCVPPDPDKNPVEVHGKGWADEKRVALLTSPDEWEERTPFERRFLSNFDDCTSCLRKKVLKEVPIPDISYGEDMVWCKGALLKGYAIVTEPSARVYHYHHHTFKYLLKRMCVDQVLTRNEFGYLYNPTFCHTLKRIVLEAGSAVLKVFAYEKSFRRRLSWVVYNWKCSIANNLGKYIGGIADDPPPRFFSPRKGILRIQWKLVHEVMHRSLIHD